jgi:predicted ribosome quality control (RQC) complex YloA/Tae2 family protein
VGKNAANNDLLTIRYAHKNDLWLHAKDVSGSHVVIKQQSQTFPIAVITYAAQLAAYYSKLKGSTLVPVSYTLKKYVRKPKGMEPGQVIVDREEVILVEPKLEL